MQRKKSLLTDLKRPSVRTKPKAWYQQKEFLDERSKWYEKLKKAGFKDIEYHDSKTGQSLPVLRGFSQMDAIRYYHADAAEYYRLAEQHIRLVKKEYGAKSWQAKAWTLHSKGVGIMRIAAALKTPTSAVQKLVRIERDNMLHDQHLDDLEGVVS